ncbi:MAG: hypothetical protein ABR910_09515 [Acidobacteriaceae bacterium]
MATFAVSVESQTKSAPAQLALKSDRCFAALLVSALTLFALAIHGYHPFAEDGGLYAAGVKRLIDPTLYPHATAFVLEPTRFSLFAPTVAALTRALPLSRDIQLHTALPIVVLTLHLATIWLTLFAAWILAARCWPTRAARTGAVTLLASWLGLPIAGTALLMMDPYLSARSFATPCMILALAGALDLTSLHAPPSHRRRGLALCAASLTLALAMHPLMAAYALAATLALICIRSPHRNIRIFATLALSLSALALAALSQHLTTPESPAYLRVAATRTYWFPAEWRWYELAGLAAPLAIAAWGGARTTRPRNNPPHLPAQTQDPLRSLARTAFVAGATALAVAGLFAHAGAATQRVARLQPLREFQIVYLIMVLALGAQLGEFLLRRSAWRWCAAIALLAAPMFAAASATFPNSPHLELPGAANPNPWLQAFLWIRDNAPTDALFALDADYIHAPREDAHCFRAIAERSALPDYSKDGGEASIAPSLTPAWTAAQTGQHNLSAPSTTAARLAALTPLGVTWLVLQSTASTHLACPYRNPAVAVCRID